MVRQTFAGLFTELASLDFGGRRCADAAATACAVALAIVAALALHSDQTWWAAISAFMTARASLAESLPRGVLRVIGSAAGAVVGVGVVGLFAYQQLPLSLCLFAMAFCGLFGFAASRYGYGWLMVGITGNLVVLIAINQPQTAFMMAVDRVIDVIIGTGSSLLVIALMPDPEKAPAATPPAYHPPPRRFWLPRHRKAFDAWLRDNWPLILHAGRGGLTVALLPYLINFLAPLSSTQIGITAVAVMSIPTTALREPDARTVVMRGVHRLVGGLFGAALGVLCLGWAGSAFVVWLPTVMAGTWLCWQIQTGSAGVAYVGTQGGLAFLMSLVQGEGPPTSITPGLDRLVGILAGLTLLLLITMAVSLFRVPFGLHAAAPPPQGR
jgi:uncharacterized membrane protein YccC